MVNSFQLFLTSSQSGLYSGRNTFSIRLRFIIIMFPRLDDIKDKGSLLWDTIARTMIAVIQD